MLRTIVVSFMAAVVLASGLCEPSQRSKPVIRVSKETTYLVEPLDAEGYVDYVEAVDRLQSRGVTLENNFEVVVRELIGANEVSVKNQAGYFDRLGMKIPPRARPVLQDFSSFHATKDQEKRAEIDREESLIMSQPWSTKDYPLGQQWLVAMGPALDRLVAGTRRSHYYTPYVDESSGNDIPSLLGAISSVQVQRKLTRCLMMRAYSRIAAGDIQGTWADSQTIHRQARLIGQRTLLFERLVGSAIESNALEVDIALLRSGTLTTEFCRQCLKDLQSLAPYPTCIETYNGAERLFVLDGIHAGARSGGRDVLNIGNAEWPDGPLENCELIDWNATLETINAEFDAFTVAYKNSDSPSGRERLAAYAKRLQPAVDQYNDSKRLKKIVLDGEPRERGQQLARLLIGCWATTVPLVNRVDFRLQTRLALTRIAYALELHRFERGHYPKSLDALTPNYLTTVPVDINSDKPLIYRTGGPAGFIVYSVGENHTDEGGKQFERNADRSLSDDIAVEGPPSKKK